MRRFLLLSLLLTVLMPLGAAAQGYNRTMTVKDFRRMSAKDTTTCVLRGVVTRVRDADRGNLFIDDGTGEVYIYVIRNDWQYRGSFRKCDVREGDTLTLRGRRSVYNGVIEMKYAFLCAKSDGPDHDSMPVRERMDREPSFRGGNLETFRQWAQNEVPVVIADAPYPGEGTVTVQFVVGKNGKVMEVQIVKGVNAAVNAIAMDIVKRSPKWKPGKNDGKGVRVTYQIPLVFTAQQ